MDSNELINYFIEAEPIWFLRRKEGPHSDKERKLIEKLFKALATRNHIKSIDIEGKQYSDEEFLLFIDCLGHNESVTELRINCYSADEDRDKTVVTNRLLTALANRNISLRSLELPWGPDYSDGGVAHLLELIRSNPDLRRLHISGSFNDDDVVAIINQLRESCENLTSFYIGGDLTFDGLCRLAEFAGQSRVLQSVNSSTNLDIELSDQQFYVLSNLLGKENTKLMEFGTWSNHKLDLLRRNKELEIEERAKERHQKFLDLQEQKKNHVEYIHAANYDLTKFPSELIFSLLVYSGMLSSISAFFKTCKHWRAVGRKSNFWKHLAAHVLPVVEPKVLEFVEVFYAEHVQKYGAENSNFWEILVKHAYSYHVSAPARWTTVGITDITTTRLPFHHPQPSPFLHEQFLTALYRRYPGLMPFTQSCDITTVKGESAPRLFLHLVSDSMPYFHIVIQTVGNTNISGIFFVSNYDRKYPLLHIEQALDYFAAESLDDALVKSKRMIETFYVAHGRSIDYSETRFSTASLLARAGENHSKLREQISNILESVAERIISQFNIGGNQVDVVTQLTILMVNRLREQTIVSNADLPDKKQKLPSRNILHTLYPARVLKELSFVSNSMDRVRGVELQPIRPQPKKKPRLSSLKGTIMKCIRVMVNFIVMPVLQVLWPRHVREMEQGPTSVEFKLPDGLYRHYYENFKPLSGVTVDNAAPVCWPMTALVFASQIAEHVGLIFERLVGLRLQKINKEDINIVQLMEPLSIDENLIPPKHIAGFQEVVSRIIEFS